MIDIKCALHPTQDIVLICKSCSNYKPVCLKCITSMHKSHELMDIEDMDDSIKNQIRLHYYNNTLPQLDTILDNCKSKLVESDNHFKQIEQDHDINFTKLESTFKNIKDIINTKEYDLKRQLLTKFDENKEINTTNSTLCNNIITTINNIKNENNKNNNNNSINNIINQNQFIELVKRNDQCNTFSSSITTTNNSNNNNNNNNINNNNNNKLEQYKDTTMIVSEDSIDSIKDKINLMIQISDKPNKPLKVENGHYKYKCWMFKVYQDGMDISTINHTHLAIDYGHHLPPVFPQCVRSLLLPDGFDQPLSSLPSQINSLWLCNIKLQLTEGSIPNSIFLILFGDGFSQRLSKAIMSRSIQHIYLGDTLYPLEENVKAHLPNANIYIMKSHKHQVPTAFNGRVTHVDY